MNNTNIVDKVTCAMPGNDEKQLIEERIADLEKSMTDQDWERLYRSLVPENERPEPIDKLFSARDRSVPPGAI
jgi:hypothetical protein